MPRAKKPFQPSLNIYNPPSSSTPMSTTSLPSSPSTSSTSSLLITPDGEIISAPFLRSLYNYDRDAVSNETGLKCEDVSLTRQDDADDADINVIVGRFLRTGELPTNVKVPEYGDFSQATDYKSSLDLVRKAEQAFSEFPAEIRAKYNHNVGLFLDAVYQGEIAGVELPDKPLTPPPANPAPDAS